jgi:hypothetical protein
VARPCPPGLPVHREPAVEWTKNVSEHGAKPAKRHQAVSEYRINQRTLARWCRTRSYLNSAAARGLTTLEAITAALAGRPWPPLSSRLRPQPESSS